ncbi:hypothetical protein DDV93_01470 [Cereibacter johrii]|nr:hypothetical protein DDV93_01470 [Cereibacter johrii]RDS96270.1 hypothetical protein DWF04_09855 [Cereibacter sphaeroides f. sp. denitrificans]
MPGCGPGTVPSDLFRPRGASVRVRGFRGRVGLHDPLRGGGLRGGRVIPVRRGRRRRAPRGLRVAGPGGREVEAVRLTLGGHVAKPADGQHGQEDDDSEHGCHLTLPLAR